MSEKIVLRKEILIPRKNLRMNQHLTYIKPKLEKWNSALWGWFM